METKHELLILYVLVKVIIKQKEILQMLYNVDKWKNLL
jgi:hypothetical protein